MSTTLEVDTDDEAGLFDPRLGSELSCLADGISVGHLGQEPHQTAGVGLEVSGGHDVGTGHGWLQLMDQGIERVGTISTGTCNRYSLSLRCFP